MSIPTKRLDSLDTTNNPQRDHEVAAMRDSISNKLRIDQILGLMVLADLPSAALAASNHTIDAAIADLLGLDPADRNVQKAIESLAARGGKFLREVFYLFDHIPGDDPPDNSGAAKYIRLTAGQSGAGGYNEGLLTDEIVDGSFPLVEATAEIAVGPLAGQRVALLNTEEAFLRARETSGVLQMDQMQRIEGRVQAGDGTPVTSGAFTFSSDGSSLRGLQETTGRDGGLIFDSANSPDARVSSTTSGETRSKNRSATAYMRVA